MKKHWLITVAVVAFVAGSAAAADSKTTRHISTSATVTSGGGTAVSTSSTSVSTNGSSTSISNSATSTTGGHSGSMIDGGTHREWTLQEARKYAHEYAEKLDKMSESEWAEHQQRRHEWMEKWSKMTPQEREAWKEKKQEMRERMHEGMMHDSPAAGKTSTGNQ